MVKEIARQSQTGPATVVISGIAEGMRSAAFSVIVVAAGTLVPYASGEWALGDGGGVYGVAIAAIGVLATLGITISVDAYGPIADNAGGIAQMAHLPSEVREATDALDCPGQHHRRRGQGFRHRIGGRHRTCPVRRLHRGCRARSIDLTRVTTLIGLFLGAMFPFLVRRPHHERGGAGSQPDDRRGAPSVPGDPRSARRSVRMPSPTTPRASTSPRPGALREMIIPGSLAIVLPLVIGFIDVEALGALLAGALVTGFLLAIFMANAGGAWDNAKKFIEAGAYGGKGSESHKAAVIGDTVGDPFKDTSGPAMNIVIKVMTIVSLIFASAFVA